MAIFAGLQSPGKRVYLDLVLTRCQSELGAGCATEADGNGVEVDWFESCREGG